MIGHGRWGCGLPVFEGWNGVWVAAAAGAAAGKRPVDPEVLPNASKLAKPAFALAFCVTGGGDGRTEGRTHTNKQTKNTMRKIMDGRQQNGFAT